MAKIKGKTVQVLTIDWIDDYSTIRQSVDTFEDVEDARKALSQFDAEVNDWVKSTCPDWKREGDGISFVEYGKEGNYFDSHAVAKITMNVIK